jgi:hypothetical protein
MSARIFAVRVPQRQLYVTETHSTARIQTTTYSTVALVGGSYETSMWTIAVIMSTTNSPQITKQASNQMSPLALCWVIKLKTLSLCPSAVRVYKTI